MSSTPRSPSTTSTVMRTSTRTRTRASTTRTNINGRLTYWCYQCDMSVSLFSSSPPLHCPHCRGQFLVEMDDYSSSTSNPNSNSNSNLPPPLHPFPTIGDDDDDDLDSSSFQIPSSIRVSDAYLLDRLIQHLSDPQDNNNDATLGHNSHHHVSSDSLPASKASVESIPTIKITSSYLASETIICAVCKDDFLIDDEAKQLPCNHIYHFDCILPWLKQHNSCPVCRFRLPVDKKPERKRFSRSRNGTRVSVRFGNLVENDDDDDDDDEEEEEEEEEEEALLRMGMGSTLRHIARRHRLICPTRRSNAALDSSSSPTQMAQAETSSAGPANSGETVSSWPIEGGSRMGGGAAAAAGGSGSGAGAGSGRVDEDGDTVMSEVRGGY